MTNIYTTCVYFVKYETWVTLRSTQWLPVYMERTNDFSWTEHWTPSECPVQTVFSYAKCTVDPFKVQRWRNIIQPEITNNNRHIKRGETESQRWSSQPQFTLFCYSDSFALFWFPPTLFSGLSNYGTGWVMAGFKVGASVGTFRVWILSVVLSGDHWPPTLNNSKDERISVSSTKSRIWPCTDTAQIIQQLRGKQD